MFKLPLSAMAEADQGEIPDSALSIYINSFLQKKLSKASKAKLAQPMMHNGVSHPSANEFWDTRPNAFSDHIENKMAWFLRQSVTIVPSYLVNILLKYEFTVTKPLEVIDEDEEAYATDY